ncbi:ArsR family transcriptional regulator [bacterium]|nr:transcriptional regulator [Chloroflexi bacterium CFX6]RIL09105.1 MAG: ArsR family transcriptional regulator [bacterium]
MEYTIDEAFARPAALYQALGHPVRLQILDVLAQGEACVCHLTTVLGKRQPYVSQQLAALREAALVSDRREGTLIYYRIRDPRLVALLALGRTLAGGESGSTGERARISEGPVPDCPCPRCQAASGRLISPSTIHLHA